MVMYVYIHTVHSLLPPTYLEKSALLHCHHRQAARLIRQRARSLTHIVVLEWYDMLWLFGRVFNLIFFLIQPAVLDQYKR